MSAPDTLPRSRVLGILGAFALGSLGCYLLNLTQYFLSGHFRFNFLYWNLFLAWLPLVFALSAERLARSPRPRGRIAFAMCAAAWFAFFPNAPYIATDFVHLPDMSWRSLWYLDLLILFSFAWTGLCLGYLSLHLMQAMVQRRFGAGAGWGFAAGVLALSSFGIYLGRFSRLNSWDILRRPTQVVVKSVLSIDPISHPTTLAFSVALFVFLLISYGTLAGLINLQGAGQSEA